jgi:phenylacetate-coenzyme A ligase PaaK-like adenylate-forming protein
VSELQPIVREARARAMRSLPTLMARIDWPRDRLDAFRARALRQTLGHAIECSPWHRDRLGGLDPRTFRVEDVASLPTMTKADLMGAFDRIATDPRVTLRRCEEHIESGELLMDGELAVFASGGSSGVRALGVEHVVPLAEAWTCGMLRFLMRWTVRKRHIPRFILPLLTHLRSRSSRPSMVGIGAAPGPHASHILGRLFGGGGRASFSVVDPLEEIVAGLNRLQPRHMVAFASFIPRLLEETRQGRLRIRPRIVSPVAEPLLPEHETAIAEVWGATIFTSWGATEVTGIGASSGFESGMLLQDDLQIVEPVDERGIPVAAGQRAAKVFVTPLRPRALPLIRYEITDQVTLLGTPAVCGSSFTRISSVTGRLDDEFIYDHGIRVHPHLFRTVLGRRRAITEYQVEQTPRGAAIRVVLVAGEHALDGDRVMDEVREHLAKQGLRGAEIGLEIVSHVDRHEKSGKLKRFIPLGSPNTRPSASELARG